jgi:hypothetical protein
MHESVLVPVDPRVTLVGDTEHVRPLDGDMLVESETVPVNPRTGVTTIAEVPAESAFVVTLVGLEAIM